MKNIIIYLTDKLSERFNAVVPGKQHSQLISLLIEKEVERRENLLYQTVTDIENDKETIKEIEIWSSCSSDGIDEYVKKW